MEEGKNTGLNVPKTDSMELPGSTSVAQSITRATRDIGAAETPEVTVTPFSSRLEMDPVSSPEGMAVEGHLSEGEESSLLKSPNAQSPAVDAAAEELGRLRMKRRNLSTAEKKRATKARLAAAGIEWDPKKWKNRKGKKAKAANIEGEGSAAGSQKRPRGESVTPVSVSAQRKRPRTDPELPAGHDPAGGARSYREAASAIKLAVVPDNFPDSKITEEQRVIIEDELMDHFKILENGYFPSFSGSYLERGAVIISCRDELTKDWVTATIAERKPLGEDLPLKVGLRKEILRANKVFFRAPARLSNRSTEQVIDFLEKQNPDLLVKDWRIVAAKPDSRGQGFVCFVDDACLELIKKAGLRACVGLWQVSLVIMTGKDNAKGPADKPTTQ